MQIDAHAHLDMFDDDLDSALAEIESGPILTVAVSMDPASYEKTRQIAQRCRLAIPTFGVHPWSAPQWAGRLNELIPLVDDAPMIGEIGLDFHFVEDRAAYRPQREVFDFFLAAAGPAGLIVNLHTKGAEREVLDALAAHDIDRAVVHWYSGPIGIMQGYFDRGYFFTVGVELLVSEAIGRIAARIPEDLLLTETDNPGGYEWYAKKRGMPSLVGGVVTKLAEVRKTTPETITETVRANFARLIGDDERLAPWAGLI